MDRSIAPKHGTAINNQLFAIDSLYTRRQHVRQRVVVGIRIGIGIGFGIANTGIPICPLGRSETRHGHHPIDPLYTRRQLSDILLESESGSELKSESAMDSELEKLQWIQLETSESESVSELKSEQYFELEKRK